VWSFVKTFLPITVSATALAFVLHDRRAHLYLKEKRGKWCELDRNYLNKTEVIFTGIVEIYNASSRANAVREYQFFRHVSGDEWIPMDSEQYNGEQVTGRTPDIFNQTALTLAPFSATELKVQAFAKMDKQPHEMTVKIVIEDLFENSYSLKVKVEMR